VDKDTHKIFEQYGTVNEISCRHGGSNTYPPTPRPTPTATTPTSTTPNTKCAIPNYQHTGWDDLKRAGKKFAKNEWEGAKRAGRDIGRGFKDVYKMGAGAAKLGGKALGGGIKLGAKGGYNAAKLGLKAIDPFSSQGLLGKTASAAKKAENWARTGAGDPYGAIDKKVLGTGGRLNLDKDLKTGKALTLADQQKVISDYRQKYIYPKDKDHNLNQQVADALGITYSKPLGKFVNFDKTAQDNLGFPYHIVNRNRNITSAAHLANLLVDDVVSGIRKGVPVKMAYKNAYGSINNPNVINALIKAKVLPNPN